MERLKEYFYIALANLRANAARSVLSVMGIVIGIAAVITVLAFGSGVKQEILRRVNSLGVNVFTIYASFEEKTRRVGVLEMQDLERLQSLPFVITAFPNLNMYKDLRTRNASTRGTVRGVESSYVVARELRVIAGRNFSPLESEQRARVCLLNEDAASELYPGEEPVGKPLYIEGAPWQVVGVYSARNPRSSRRRTKSTNIELLAPAPTLLRNDKEVNIYSLEVHVRPDSGPHVDKNILQAMERSDPKRAGLFRVVDQMDILEKTMEIRNMLSLIGVIVAGVSLIVGGIGMMNVMLTSVAERTREIGVRRAVGARRKDILFQFLVEASVLSVIGGFLGLIGGSALARGLPLFFKGSLFITPQIQPTFLLISVGTGVLMGLIFGLYPAVKASRLLPAEALRSE